MIRNTISWYRDPYRFLDRRIEKGNYDFRIDLPGARDAFIVGSPELIDETVRDRNLVGGEGLSFVQPFTGPRALIAISGTDHQSRRRPIQALFYSADNRWMVELTEKYCERAARDVRPGQVFSLVEFYERVTLHVIIDYVLGASDDEHGRFYSLLRQWMQSFRSPIWIFLKPLQRDLGSFSPWGRFLAGREAVRKLISERLQAPIGEFRSVLARLITERNDGGLQITDEDLVWQCIELLLFGHDTTACATAWAAMHLLDNSMVGSSELESPAFLEACTKESLRLTPVVVHVTRQATADTRIGGQTVRKGQKVFPCAYLAHRHRDYYDRPGTFDPCRFLNGSSPARYAWFPFGLGGRICVGMPFAMEQLQVLLRRTLDLGKLAKASSERTRAERKFILMAPEGGGLVRVESSSRRTTGV